MYICPLQYGSSILCVDASQLCISCSVDCCLQTQYSNSNSNSTNIGMISRGLPVAGSVQVLRPISALSLAKIIWPEYWDSKRHWRLLWTNACNTGCRNMMVRWSTHSEA